MEERLFIEKMTIIPDADFLLLSKKVKELRKLYYANQDIKVDFVNLLFARIDELLEKYALALKENAEQEIFTKIKNALEENCYLLNTALDINDLIQVQQQLPLVKTNKFKLLMDDSTTNPLITNELYNQIYSKSFTLSKLNDENNYAGKIND